MKKNRWWLNLLGLVAIMISMVPIYLTLSSSLKPKTDLTSKWLLPDDLYLDNYLQVLKDNTFIQAIINTIIMVVGSLFIVMVIGSITGYALARLKTKLSSIVYLFSLGAMMVPTISLIVPIYKMMIQLKLINTMLGAVILVGTYSLPLSIFIYTNFIKSIPSVLDEAANIDGCNKIQTFYRIILPQLGPVTVSILIISGVKIYNNYMIPLYMLQGEDQKVATTYVANFFAEYPQLNIASAAALLSALPVVLVYLFLQRYFISGATEGIGK